MYEPSRSSVIIYSIQAWPKVGLPDASCLHIQEPFLHPFTQDILLLDFLLQHSSINPKVALFVFGSMMFGQIIIDTFDDLFQGANHCLAAVELRMH